MEFLKGVTKDLEKAGLQVGASEPPRYWFSSGNHVLNKIISGSFLKAIPQGRLLSFTGPSGAGKSFLACNAMKAAQEEGAHLIVLDSENALDDDFVKSIGVDPHPDLSKPYSYTYVPVDTIPQVKKVVASYIKGYKSDYGNDPDAPKLLFVIDSLDMLMTETESTNFDKGVSKGDQGQRNKQLKAMLREFVQAVKRPNISMIVTSQVYKNQDVTNGEGVWIVSDAVRFALSQIVMLTKLKLRDKDTRETHGIRMKCEGFKTRFTQPYQTVTIEVPYEEGMDPYNGLIDVAIKMDIIQQKGAWCQFGEHKWQKKYLPKEHQEAVLAACEAQRKQFLDALVKEEDEETPEETMSAKKRRLAKAAL